MHGGEDLALLELRFGALTYNPIVLCRSSTERTVYSISVYTVTWNRKNE